MAEILVPIKNQDGLELFWIIDDVEMVLVGIRGNNRGRFQVKAELSLGDAPNQKFDTPLPRNDATDRESRIPSPRRVPVRKDPEGGWEIDFVSFLIETVY